MFNKLKDLPPHLRISTFGIGKDFDAQLVNVLAKKGKGSVSRIYDLEQGSLSAAAVLALNRAMYPSLSGCSIHWTGSEKEELNQVFYNELVSSYRLVNRTEFESGEIDFTFACDENPSTGKRMG